MREPTIPKLSKWPFLLGDALLLGCAWFVQAQSQHPLALWQLGLVAACVAVGAFLAVLPFVLEYRAATRLTETDALASTVAQVQKLETIAAQVSSATGQWQNVQDAADKTNAAAQSIADRMTAEGKAFMEFMTRANDSERSSLRLEAEKLKRAEADWIQVLVRMLDHVYALHQGALHSRQAGLIEQIGRFQTACYDAARRVGIAPFVASPAEPFSEERHKPVDGDGAPAPGSVVQETVGTGITYQGRVVRPALVRLRGTAEAPADVPSSAGKQAALPLDGQPGAAPPS